MDPDADHCPHCGEFQAGELCKVCRRSRIPRDASKCLRCDSRRGIFRFLSVSQVTLSLIIALIGLVSAVGPGLVKWLYPHTDFDIELKGFENKNNNSKITFVATNRGNISGRIASARLVILRQETRKNDLASCSLCIDLKIIESEPSEIVNPGEWSVIVAQTAEALFFAEFDLGGQKFQKRTRIPIEPWEERAKKLDIWIEFVVQDNPRKEIVRSDRLSDFVLYVSTV